MRLRSQLRQEKKATSFTSGQLVLLILILVTTALMLLYISRLRESYDAIAEKGCAAQIREADRRNTWEGREFAMELDACQTKQIPVNSTNPLAVQKTVADAMTRCWDEWGRGNVDLFKTDGEYCHACSVISFEKDIGEIPDFQNYLASTKTPRGETYLQRLTPGIRDTDEIIESPVYTLRTDTDYAVLIWYSRQREDGFRKRLYDWTGYDVTPTQIGAASGTMTFALGLFGTAYAAGAVSQTPIVGAPLAAIISEKGAAFTNKATIAAIGASYIYARASEGWYTTSAIYLTPNEPGGYYARQCDQMASTTKSP